MDHVLIYSYDLSGFDYGDAHPFKPMRAKLFVELLHRYSMLYYDMHRILEPGPIDEDLLYLFHDRKYIELLRRADGGEFTLEMFEAGLGTGDNPIFKGVFRYSLTVAGGTQQGAMELYRGGARVVFNPIAGLHHAGKNQASGFCYVNDIAVAISDLVRRGQRVAYIDLDAHHGNGVQDAFYDSREVLTISLHESGETLYPGSGFEDEIGSGSGIGYNVNVPLRQGTDDEVYVYAFEEIVPPLVERFRPDIVFAQIGGDTHKDDPLAHLNLTSNGYKHVISRLKAISPKILAMGGGGYNPGKTAALWALAWGILCDLEPVDQFAGLVGGMMFGPEMQAGSLEDPPFILEGPDKERCFENAKRVVSYLQRTVFPLHDFRVKSC